MEKILTEWTAEPKSLEIQRTDGATLFDSDSVYDILWNYWTYSLIAAPSRNSLSWVWQCWLNYLHLYVPDLERAYDALYSEYDPLANYDLTETSNEGEMLDDKTDTVTPQGKTISDSETLGGLDTETKNFAAGYDTTDQNGAFTDRQTSKTTPDTVDGYHVKTTVSYEEDAQTATVHTAENGLTNDFLPGSGYNRLNDHRLRRFGNIGVTSTVQLILQELELRKQELLADFLRRFVLKHFAIMG